MRYAKSNFSSHRCLSLSGCFCGHDKTRFSDTSDLDLLSGERKILDYWWQFDPCAAHEWICKRRAFKATQAAAGTSEKNEEAEEDDKGSKSDGN
jgi:hypothetical protein